MTVILEAPVRDWYCPNCGQTDQTREVRPHTRFHTCPKLRGLTAPMLPAGTKAKVVAVEREDYVGAEQVRTNDAGRPIMAVRTEYDDGRNDVAVFAPTAVGRGEVLDG